MNCSIPGLPIDHQLPEPTQTHVHWVSDAIQPSHPLSSPSPPALNLSIRVFSNESGLSIRQPKYWSFSFNISPPNEHPGLISFRMEWLDLLAVQGTLKSSPTPQFKSIYQYLHTIYSCFFAHTLTHTDIHTDTKTKCLKLGLFPSSLEPLSQWKSYFQMVWNLLHRKKNRKNSIMYQEIKASL